MEQAQAGSGRPLELPMCDDRPVWDVALSLYLYPVLTVADEVGVFRRLLERPATAAEVARSTEIGPRAAEALLATLSAAGFLRPRDGTYELTTVAREYLVPQSPYYFGEFFRLTRAITSVHDLLLNACRRDQATVYGGRDVWEVHEADPEQAKAFTAAMHAHSLPAALGVARSDQLAGVRRLLDVGGGSGCFPIALVQRYQDLRCTVLELPAVCPITEEYLRRYGVTDRVDTLGANMFTDPFPAGYDGIFFSNVFHDWDEASCEHLTRRSFEALPSGGRIYLHEMLLDDAKDGPTTAALFSAGMVVWTKGKQFTAGELDSLLRRSGFDDVHVHHTFSYYSLVSARKP